MVASAAAEPPGPTDPASPAPAETYPEAPRRSLRKIAAYITDELSGRRILDPLGLSSPEQEEPPPAREVVRVPIDDEGREIQAARGA